MSSLYLILIIVLLLIIAALAWYVVTGERHSNRLVAWGGEVLDAWCAAAAEWNTLESKLRKMLVTAYTDHLNTLAVCSRQAVLLKEYATDNDRLRSALRVHELAADRMPEVAH